MTKSIFAAFAATAALCPASVLAQQHSSQTVTASADTQEFSKNVGSLRSASFEYKFSNDDTTVTFTPTVGERRAPGLRQTAVGGGASVYQDWSSRVSTRTHAFVAEDQPVFAQYDFAQDVTVKVGDSTAVTVGGRWARYFGRQDVTFLSAGIRQYFKGGSISYRLTRVDPDGRSAYLAHLVNLSVNDPHGHGKTQLWLSAGEASLSNAQVAANFSGEDYGAVLQRVQPLTERLSLIPTVGYASYDRPGNRLDAINLGLGIALGLD
jgi:YaiO family outer membrane protein